MLNEDYKDMLRALCEEEVRFLLNKRKTGRTKGLADAEALESLRDSP